MQKHLSSQGFTLLELLISIVLLAVGFLAVYSVLWSSAKGGMTSRNMTVAANVAGDVLERCANLPYDSLPSTAGFVDYTSQNLAAKGAGMSRSWLVQDNTPSPGVKTVTLRVTWSEKGSTKERTFTMTKRRDF